MDGRTGASGRVPHNSKIAAAARQKYGQYTDETLVSHAVQLEAQAEEQLTKLQLKDPLIEAPEREKEQFLGVMIDQGTNFSCHGQTPRKAYETSIGRAAH